MGRRPRDPDARERQEEAAIAASHFYNRWRVLVSELEGDIAGFLQTIRKAISSSTVIAAKVFTAWHTANLPQCRSLVDKEMKEIRGDNRRRPEFNIRRFVYFLFWRASTVERRSGNMLRTQIIAVAERLEYLKTSGKWDVPDDLSVEEVMAKIKSEGGLTRMYDNWREKQTKLKLAEKDERRNALATRLGVQAEHIRAREEAHRSQHQQRRDAELQDRFAAMLHTISEDLAWHADDQVMLVAAVKREDGRVSMTKLRLPYQRRMMSAVVKPSTRIE